MPVEVIPPALDAAGGGQRTGVNIARRDGAHAARQPAHVHGGRTGGCRAVAELPVEVAPPALDAAGGGQRTGVNIARRDGAHAARQPAHVHGGGTGGCRAVAELPGEVAPPALDAAGGGQRTGVTATRRDGAHAACQPAHVHGGGTVGCRAVAELPEAVIPPALDAAGGGQRTGVTATRRDGAHAARQPAHVHGGGTGGCRAVAELPRAVPPPALDAAGGGQRTGVTATRRDGAHAARQPAHVHGGGTVGCRAVAELPEAVIPPALDAAGGGQRTGVIIARRDGAHAARQPAHVHGGGTVGCRAVAELPRAVIPPALDAAGGGQRTGVIIARRDGAHAARQPAHVHGGGTVGGCRAVAELPEAVIPPALDAAGGGQRTGVMIARRDGAHAARQPAHVHGGGTVGCRAVAELPVEVIPPALDAASGGQRTGVNIDRRDGAHAACQPAHVHGGGTVGGCRAVAELPVEVVPPALDAAGGGQRTGVNIARRDGAHAARQPAHVHGGGTVGGCRAVAELPGEVAPPALDAAGGGQRTGVTATRRDGAHAARQPAHVHGGGTVGCRAVAELPVEVIPPALDAAGGGQRTGVMIARRDGAHAACQPAHVHGGGTLGCRAVAELPEAVPPPALDAAGGGQRTGVTATRRDGAHAARQPAHVHGGGTVGCRAVAELPEAVIPPALDAAGGGQRTGVKATRRDGSGGYRLHQATLPGGDGRGVAARTLGGHSRQGNTDRGIPCTDRWRGDGRDNA